MKRLFTLILGLIPMLALSAQNDFPVQFADKNGNIIADGTTIRVTDHETDDFGSVLMSSGLFVKNTSSEAVQCGGRYTIRTISSGTLQTCFPLNCVRQTSTGTFETGNGSIASAELKNMLTEWLPTGEGTCYVEYQLLTYRQNPNNGKWMVDADGPKVTLLFNYDPSGKASSADAQMWWGYFSDADAPNLPYDGNLGYSRACTIDAAIYVPANDGFVGASTIKAVRFWLGNEVSAISGDVKVWISKHQPTDISTADYVQTMPKSSMTSGANEIELTTPFAVNNQGIYVGFTFSISRRAYPVMSYGNDLPGAFLYRVNSGEWEDLSGEDCGRLALQLLIEGGSFPTNSVTVSDFGQSVVQKGTNRLVPVTFTNTGREPVTTISYTIATEGGSTTEETTLNIGSMPLYGTYTARVPFASDDEAKKYLKTLTVTKVNGVENTASEKSGKGSLITIFEKVPVVPVVEEFTGTWCGWCPYGMVGMQKAHEAYGGQAVLIAAHSGDPMECSDYASILDRVGSFPSANINRETDFYPSSGTILRQIEAAFDRPAQGKVELSATWADKEKGTVRFDTKCTFVYNDDNAQYGIAFVLLEDGMENSTWGQSNYLSGDSGDSDMTFWYNSPGTVYGLKFDHVAVAAWDIQNGVSGSVPTKIQADSPLNFSYIGDISSNSLIQDKSKLKAVALLVDRMSGTIVNAAQVAITDNSAGIKGDVDGDGSLTEMDVLATVALIFNGGSVSGATDADLNGDGQVNIADIVCLVNLLNAK